MDGAGVPVEFSKGEAARRSTRDQPRLRRSGEMADRHVIYNTARRRSPVTRPRDYVHGEVLHGRVWISCHVHSSVWDADAKTSLCGTTTRTPLLARLPRVGSPARSRPAGRARPTVPRPMNQQLDEEAGGILRKVLERMGMTVHTGQADHRDPGARRRRERGRVQGRQRRSTATWSCSPPASGRTSASASCPG